MAKPYGLMSDLHANNWSAFATLDSEGRNSRLMHTIHEIDRCCEETQKVGGDTVWIAGDLFHVRGSISPIVFNTLREVLLKWKTKGLTFKGIPGNHDLSDRESNALGSAVQMLIDDGHCEFYHKCGCKDGMAWVPWVSNSQDYLKSIEEIRVDMINKGFDTSEYDLICHIGVDGTLTNLPAHGVSAERMADFGFKRVFSGHYHNHRDFGNSVWSIGATTHHTWGDVNTKAGFMIVYEDRVKFFASHAPSFIELTGEEEAEDIPLIVDGHFVQAKISASTLTEVANWRQALLDMNAKGVVIAQTGSKAAVTRVGLTVKSMSSLDNSVSTYCTEKKLRPNVATLAADVLVRARAVS